MDYGELSCRQSQPRPDAASNAIGSAIKGGNRPKGSLNKTTVELKQAILGALQAAGGKEGSVGYLRRLAIENSSAFAALLGRVLPMTITGSEQDGKFGVRMTFERVVLGSSGRLDGAAVKVVTLTPEPFAGSGTRLRFCPRLQRCVFHFSKKFFSKK
jgi:hypothetical protein